MKAKQLKSGTPFRIVEHIGDEVRWTDYRASVGPCRYPQNVPVVRTQTTQMDSDAAIRYRRGPYYVHSEIHGSMPVVAR